MYKRLSVPLVSACLVLSACSTGRSQYLAVGPVWGSQVGKLGIYPFFPPREDVQLGDLYMVVGNPCGTVPGARSNEAVRLGGIGDKQVAELIASFDGTRLVYPETYMKPAVKESEGSEAGGAKTVGTAASAKAAKSKAAAVLADAAAKAASAKAASLDAAAKKKGVNAAVILSAAAADKAAAQKKAAAAKADAAAAADASAATKAGSESGAPYKLGAANDSPKVTTTSPPTVQITISNGAVTPATAPAQKANDQSSTTTQQPGASSADTIMWVDGNGTFKTSSRPITRLRLAAFPEVSLGTVTKAELQATAPVSAAGHVSAGGAYTGTSIVDVSATDVEVSSVPAPLMMAAAIRFLKTTEARMMLDPYILGTIQTNEENKMIDEANSAGKCGTITRTTAVFFFVNDLFLARTLKFNYGVNSAYGAYLAGGIGAASPTGAAAPASGVNSTTTTTTTSSAQASPLADFTLPTAQSLPGASVQFQTGANQSLIMNQTFDRPLAIGTGREVSFTQVELQRIVTYPTYQNQIATPAPPPAAVKHLPAPVPAPTRGMTARRSLWDTRLGTNEGGLLNSIEQIDTAPLQIPQNQAAPAVAPNAVQELPSQCFGMVTAAVCTSTCKDWDLPACAFFEHAHAALPNQDPKQNLQEYIPKGLLGVPK